MTKGLVIAAPSSGSGKTTVTLGLLRALRRMGFNVTGAKSGPDYIDPRFHETASGRMCFNLDTWAMPKKRILDLAGQAEDLLIVEGAMGLFDGAPPDGKGSVAELARILDSPVVLVVDASHMAQSVKALVHGFATVDPAIRIAGIILNKVGSPRHERILRDSLAGQSIPVIGCLFREAGLEHPARHLGLVQARENPALEGFLEAAADRIEAGVDLKALLDAATGLSGPSGQVARQRPPAQKIAVADDEAFAFAYSHILQDWRDAGAEISVFSPLKDEAPTKDAGLIFLPGGYPELHAGVLANAMTFKSAMRKTAETTAIYGECGGYMVLGKGLVDADGTRHEMLGLLGLETSFQKRKLHLGYRHLETGHPMLSGRWRGHEFHYATTLKCDGDSLFSARDAEGNDLGAMGLVNGNTCGSFAHLIDRAE